MAKLPVYNSEGGITTNTPNNIRKASDYQLWGDTLKGVSNELTKLGEEWQKAKDQVENLDGKNKLMMGISGVLMEAEQFNSWSSPEELEAKKQELSSKLQGVLPSVMDGFSNNQNAVLFQKQAEFTTFQNQVKLDEIFRNKYQDKALESLATSQDMNFRNFVQTGDKSYKQSFFNDIDMMVNAGFMTREDAAKNKLAVNDWDAEYAYNIISQNPYAQVPDEIMKGIDPRKQTQLRNFAKSERNRVKAENLMNLESAFFANPTQENLDKIIKANPKGNYSKLQDIVDSQPNYDAISNVSGLEEGITKIKELADIDTSSYKGKMEYLANAGLLASSIIKNNVRKDGNATLSINDKNKLIETIYKNMGDATFKEQLSKLPDLSNLKDIELSKKASSSYFKSIDEYNKDFKNLSEFRGKDSVWNDIGVANKLDNIKKRTMEGVINSIVVGDFQTAEKVYNAGLQAAIKTKYWYVPELQDPNLQAGKKFTLNGRVYTFQGFSNKDIIVETN